jgi:hapalindole-type alkaloid chlorinase
MSTRSTPSKGHPIKILERDIEEVASLEGALQDLADARSTGIVVRRALSEQWLQRAVTQLESEALATRWETPNAGMTGGEIRTIGEAATPTFTSFGGPTLDRYIESARGHASTAQELFGEADPTATLQRIFSALSGGCRAESPTLNDGVNWAPYNLRALDPSEQIFAHHDNHYGLDIYAHLNPRFDRTTLLSWFVTLQPAEAQGALTIYGLWGSDPNPPMLPSRFLDTEVLERDYEKRTLSLQAGDLLIFDSGRHVHRVTPVEGRRARLTLGGFMTFDQTRAEIAFWC